MTLAELKIGQTATILNVGGEGGLRQHFLDMGVLPGVPVTLVKYAPMGDPMELRVHGYELTLRRADARKIEVREDPPGPSLEGPQDPPPYPSAREGSGYSRLVPTSAGHYTPSLVGKRGLLKKHQFVLLCLGRGALPSATRGQDGEGARTSGGFEYCKDDTCRT